MAYLALRSNLGTIPEFRSLESDGAVQELAEIFALYLKDYRDVSVYYEGSASIRRFDRRNKDRQLGGFDDDGIGTSC